MIAYISCSYVYNTHWQETHNSTVQIVTVRVCTRSHGTKRGRVSPGVALPVAGSAEGRSASCVLQIKLASLISAFPALSWSWADDKSQLPAVFWSYFLSYVRAGMTSLYGSIRIPLCTAKPGGVSIIFNPTRARAYRITIKACL